MIIKKYSEHSEFQKDIDMLNNIRDIFIDVEDEFNIDLEYEFISPSYNSSKDPNWVYMKSYDVDGKMNYDLTQKFNPLLINKRWMIRHNNISSEERSQGLPLSKLIVKLRSLIERVEHAYDLSTQHDLSYCTVIDRGNSRVIYFNSSVLPNTETMRSFMFQIDFI